LRETKLRAALPQIGRAGGNTGRVAQRGRSGEVQRPLALRTIRACVEICLGELRLRRRSHAHIAWCRPRDIMLAWSTLHAALTRCASPCMLSIIARPYGGARGGWGVARAPPARPPARPHLDDSVALDREHIVEHQQLRRQRLVLHRAQHLLFVGEPHAAPSLARARTERSRRWAGGAGCLGFGEAAHGERVGPAGRERTAHELLPIR
jgi:hypothetical protein